MNSSRTDDRLKKRTTQTQSKPIYRSARDEWSLQWFTAQPRAQNRIFEQMLYPRLTPGWQWAMKRCTARGVHTFWDRTARKTAHESVKISFLTWSTVHESTQKIEPNAVITCWKHLSMSTRSIWEQILPEARTNSIEDKNLKTKHENEHLPEMGDVFDQKQHNLWFFQTSLIIRQWFAQFPKFR